MRFQHFRCKLGILFYLFIFLSTDSQKEEESENVTIKSCKVLSSSSDLKEANDDFLMLGK